MDKWQNINTAPHNELLLLCTIDRVTSDDVFVGSYSSNLKKWMCILEPHYWCSIPSTRDLDYPSKAIEEEINEAYRRLPKLR